MVKRGEFLFLGTGASAGTPMIGCRCPVCTSKDPLNKRLRPAGLVTLGEKKILIDAGPDFRAQALQYGIDRLDGVLITHAHADHVSGLDELRVYYILYRKPLPMLASKTTLKELQRRFDYIFREKIQGISLTAQLDFHTLEEERGVVDFAGVSFRYMTYTQGDMSVNGYRFGDFAYISDIHDFPETIFEDLQGVNELVVGALRHEPSTMHFTIEEAIAFGRRVGAKNTYFTHIAHDLDHAETNKTLPKGFSLAYDGLKVEFKYE